MADSRPHQTSQHHAESANVHQQGELHDLEHGNDMDNQQEGSLQTLHIGGSGYWRRSHLVHEQTDEKDLQWEIDDLKKILHWAQRKQTTSSSGISSNDDKDDSYKQRSETPPSESYSCEEEHSRKRRRRSPSGRGVGTNVMKKALSQISKSPFTRGIEKAKLPRHFHQPTFTMYNEHTDPVEHVNQFKQKMAIHSQDEVLLCRVFPSSLGLMLMRWFDGLRTNSISSFKKLTQSFYSDSSHAVGFLSP